MTHPTRRALLCGSALALPFVLGGCPAGTTLTDAQVLADAQGIVNGLASVAAQVNAANPGTVPSAASAGLTDATALLATLTASTPAPAGASTLARIDTDISNVLAAISPIVSTVYPIAGPVIAAVQTLLPVVEAWVNPLITSATGVSAIAPVSPDAAAAARKVLGVVVVK